MTEILVGDRLCRMEGGRLFDRYSPWRLSLLAVAIISVCLWAEIAGARNQRLVVEVGKGLQLSGMEDAEEIFVADPQIAEVSAAREAGFVYGVRAGETTLIGTDPAGKTLFQYDVIVIDNLDEMHRMIAQRFPGASVAIRSARGSVYVSGTVTDQRTHDDLVKSLTASLPSGLLIPDIAVADSPIIRLNVKFMEVFRDGVEAYGINWSALTGNGSGQGDSQDVSRIVDLLLDNGVATILSETTLTAVSGKKAEFKAGEEVALPARSVGNGGTTALGVDYKFVGFSIDFTPHLIAGDKVSLHVKADISEPAQTVQLAGGPAPYLASRTLATDAQLNSGESFILAGLSQLGTNATLNNPRENWGVMGEVFRSLFGHDKITTRNRDMVVVVTPQFGLSSKPSAADIVDLRRSNIEYVLLRKGFPISVRIYGRAGFLY